MLLKGHTFLSKKQVDTSSLTSVPVISMTLSDEDKPLKIDVKYWN